VPTDKDAAERQKSFMDVGAAFIADGEPAESVRLEPRQGTLASVPWVEPRVELESRVRLASSYLFLKI
jgi:hypothetical protein